MSDQAAQNSNPSSQPAITSRLSDSSRDLLAQGVVPAAPTKSRISDDEKLAVFEQVLDEVEAQQPASAQTPQQQSSGPRKEQLGGGAGGAAPVELPGGMQYVETEPQPEIPLEVESFLHKVEQHPEQQPKEIVVTEKPRHSYTPPPPKRTVRVLPITKEELEAGKKIGVQNSFRWLVEFSEKVTKMFTGAVIYRQDSK